MFLAKHSVSSGLKNFKSGNFYVRNEDRGKPPKKFEEWDQKGVIYYELLKPGETVNTNRYQQQMIDLNRALQEKRPDYRRRQHKVIFLHDNAFTHSETGQGNDRDVQLGNTGTRRLLSRLGSVGLPSVRITGPRSR